jgi:hypothetical protein
MKNKDKFIEALRRAEACHADYAQDGKKHPEIMAAFLYAFCWLDSEGGKTHLDVVENAPDEDIMHDFIMMNIALWSGNFTDVTEDVRNGTFDLPENKKPLTEREKLHERKQEKQG